MRVKDYTQGAYALIKEGMEPDALIVNLKKTLTTKGHSRLYPKILTELLRLCEKAGEQNEVIVTLARAKDEDVHTTSIRNAIEQLGGSSYTTRIDETITGGFIAEKKEARIDQSHKTRLLTIYRSLIK